MNGITPRQRGKNLKKELARIYDDGKGAERGNIIDCLTDLRHLCLAEDIDFFACDRQARDHAAVEQFSNSILSEKPRKRNV